MNLKSRQSIASLAASFILLSLTACNGGGSKNNPDNFTGLKIKLLVGSALGNFCTSAIALKSSKSKPRLLAMAFLLIRLLEQWCKVDFFGRRWLQFMSLL